MNTPAPAPQSKFVTVLAWVMVAFGAFSALMALMENVFMNMFLPTFESAMPQSGRVAGLSFAFIRGWMLAALALSVFMTYAAYALLKRRNWARFFHVALFIFGAVIHAVTAAALAFGFDSMLLPLADLGLLTPEFQSAFRIIAITCAILMLVFGIGYVWLARRLLSPTIAAEFGVR